MRVKTTGSEMGKVRQIAPGPGEEALDAASKSTEGKGKSEVLNSSKGIGGEGLKLSRPEGGNVWWRKVINR